MVYVYALLVVCVRALVMVCVCGLVVVCVYAFIVVCVRSRSGMYVRFNGGVCALRVILNMLLVIDCLTVYGSSKYEYREYTTFFF